MAGLSRVLSPQFEPSDRPPRKPFRFTSSILPTTRPNPLDEDIQPYEFRPSQVHLVTPQPQPATVRIAQSSLSRSTIGTSDPSLNQIDNPLISKHVSSMLLTDETGENNTR
jgi:hypothetical protein